MRLSAFVFIALAVHTGWGYIYPMGLKVYVLADSYRMRQIDAAETSFIYEGSIQYAWQDSTLLTNISPTVDDGDEYRVCSDATAVWPDQCHSALSSYGNDKIGPAWTPVVANVLATTTNSIDCRIRIGVPSWTGLTAETTAVWVVCTQTLSVRLLESQQLQNFPFDQQSVTLIINHLFSYTDMDIMIAPGSAATDSSSTLLMDKDPQGFQLANISIEVTHVTGQTRTSVSTVESPRLTITYLIDRVPDFFVNRFVMPLCLIHCTVILVSTAIIPVGPGIGARVTAALVAFSITVQFMFVLSKDMPALPYSTRLDKFFNCCFFNAAFLALYTTAAHIYFDRSNWKSACLVVSAPSLVKVASESQETDPAPEVEGWCSRLQWAKVDCCAAVVFLVGYVTTVCSVLLG